MDLLVEQWRGTLARLTEPGGWIGRRDAKAARAAALLGRYEASDRWIGHSFGATAARTDAGQDIAAKPDAAYRAQADRDAVLQLAFLHELHQWQARERRAFDLRALLAAVGTAAATAPTGLRPEREFAAGDRASIFFQQTLLPRLRSLDLAVGAEIAARPTALGYDPSNATSIEAWGSAWTAGASLIVLEWALQRDLGSPAALAMGLWREVDARGEPLSKFYPRAAIVPSSPKLARGVHVDLIARPPVIFAMTHTPNVRSLQNGTHRAFSFPLAAIDEAPTYDGARYHGRTVLQLYLAVLAESLHATKVTTMDIGIDPGTPFSGLAIEGDALSGLAQEHRRAVGLLDTARKSRDAIKRAAGKGQRFAAGEGMANHGLPPAAADWTLLVQRSLRFIAAAAEPGSHWQPLGSIALWRELGADVAWMDVLVVARAGTTHVRLPVTLEDVAGDADDDERSALVLNQDLPAGFDAAALRRAFEARDAVIGVAIRKGLGAFVVLEVDLSAQATP